MTIPSGSNYPSAFDTNNNLFVVHDALRVRLAEDYSPGDTSILVEELESGIMDKFPETGLITLTEQCSDIDERAISFYYSSRTSFSFDELELLDGFTDVAKPKGVTNVTQNVMDKHHNQLKDALIAIQEFVGIKGTTDLLPFGSTLEGRINFLRKLIFTPRAWFSVNRRVGLVPLEVIFKDESFRLGDGEICYVWDFGDNSCSVISGTCDNPLISVTSVVPVNQTKVLVKDLDGGTVKKTYSTPGLYDISLTVSNEHGEDEVVFSELINARIESPQEAVIEFVPRAIQNSTAGSPVGGPYTTPPTIRSPANVFIDIKVEQGENPANIGRSYAGELLNASKTPIDPVIEYTWNLGDDLNHSNYHTTRAAYGLGGIYDLTLRVDTQFGSYRITTYEDAIDIVESTNLWLWTFLNKNSNGSGTVIAKEFGLLSETFKTATSTLSINRNNSFLDFLSDTDTYDENAELRAKNEFDRNTAFAPRSNIGSGNSATALMFYAGGGSTITTQPIKVVEFNGFDDTYFSHSDISNKPWNWTPLIKGDQIFFLFGTQQGVTSPGTNLSNPSKTTYNVSTLVSSTTALTSSDFENGADELLEHVSSYDGSGNATNGYFSTYRSAWKDNTGYILRNDGVNDFFRIRSFYKTQGSLVDSVQTITKMPDMAGTTKLEGQLVTLTNGVFFFNNSGNISAFNTTSETWETGTPSLTSQSFRSLQDTSVSSFDSGSNTLLATSDKDRIAYLSYDYSTSVFLKYNGTDNSFISAGIRPSGSQFMMGVF